MDQVPNLACARARSQNVQVQGFANRFWADGPRDRSPATGERFDMTSSGISFFDVKSSVTHGGETTDLAVVITVTASISLGLHPSLYKYVCAIVHEYDCVYYKSQIITRLYKNCFLFKS